MNKTGAPFGVVLPGQLASEQFSAFGHGAWSQTVAGVGLPEE
jgi:hypothetical protein